MREYDLIADWYASTRGGPIGIPEAAALASSLARGSRVLDVGCGSGIPLSREFIHAGHHVVGFDSSREMLRRFRGNFPQTAAVRGVAQASPFADDVFDAAMAWGVLFHYERDDQMAAIASVARVLKPEGWFLFTSPYERCETGIEGTMNGVTFRYCAPFSLEDLTTVLAGNGLTVIDRHTDEGDNTCFLTRKLPAREIVSRI